jgi:hypothetical protein
MASKSGTDVTVGVETADGLDVRVTATVHFCGGSRLIEDFRAATATGEVVEDFDETEYPYLEDDLAYAAQRKLSEEGV